MILQSSNLRRFKSLFGIKTVASRRLVRASSPHTSHAISVTEAPEPSDLIWENLEVGMTTRRLFGVFSWSLKALVLIIGFLGTSLAPGERQSEIM